VITHLAAPSRLKVPGAVLHHKTRGSGPVLLVIPGGPQDAGVFAALRATLPTATPSSPTTHAATPGASSTTSRATW
jgi:hypothetical protein